MAYAPIYALGASNEVPGQILKNLAGTLGLLDSDAFDRMTVGQRCNAIWRLVMALVGLDLFYLAQHPETPSLYESGVRYRTQQTLQGQPVNTDLWFNIPTALHYGEGSCEDLAAWRVAELRLRGSTPYERQARPYVHSREQPNQLTVYHVVVRFPDNQEEDPSALLGMPAW